MANISKYYFLDAIKPNGEMHEQGSRLTTRKRTRRSDEDVTGCRHRWVDTGHCPPTLLRTAQLTPGCQEEGAVWKIPRVKSLLWMSLVPLSNPANKFFYILLPGNSLIQFMIHLSNCSSLLIRNTGMEISNIHLLLLVSYKTNRNI